MLHALLHGGMIRRAEDKVQHVARLVAVKGEAWLIGGEL